MILSFMLFLHQINNIKDNIMFDYKRNLKYGEIEVVTPYDRDFVAKARNLRGKWDKAKEAWIFDDSIEDYVKKALIDVYGTTGEEPVEYCSLLIKDFSSRGEKEDVSLFGTRVAVAWGRDSGAKLGDNIIWVAGSYTSGGSMKNWYTNVENATFEIQDFPLPRTTFDDVQEAIKEGWCEIKQTKKKRKKEDIEADIEKHEAVLEALKNELNNL